MLRKVVAVVGAALILGLLALGTDLLAQPGPPGPPPKLEPPPQITPQQIIDGVNQIIPHTKTYRPGDPGFDELALTPKNRIPIPIGAARSLDDGYIPLAFAREGVRLYAARSLDDGTILGRQAGGTRLGAIELTREYKLGSGLLKQGYYHIAAIYDPNDKPEFYLFLAGDLNNDGEIEFWAFIGLPHRELAHVIGMVDPALQVEFAQGVLLNLIAALLK